MRGIYLKQKPAKCFRPDDWMTTYEIAAACHVAPKTVVAWCDTGELENHRLPGGKKSRRVPIKAVLQFMHERGYILPPELGGWMTYHVLLVSDNIALKDFIPPYLPCNGERIGYRLLCTASAVETEQRLNYGNLDLVVVDWADHELAQQVVESLPEGMRPWLIEILPEEDSRHAPSYKSLKSITHPITAQKIAWTIRELCEGDIA